MRAGVSNPSLSSANHLPSPKLKNGLHQGAHIERPDATPLVAPSAGSVAVLGVRERPAAGRLHGGRAFLVQELADEAPRVVFPARRCPAMDSINLSNGG
jgi:hypothetical protein